MRARFLTLADLALASAWTGPAAAQSPAAWPPDPTRLAPPAERFHAPDPLPPPAVDRACPWSLDFILGLPTGFRLQRGLDADRHWLVEGFVGFELIFPTAGVGLRWAFTPCCSAEDALTISPGVDVYLLYNVLHDGSDWFHGGPRVVGLAAADVDV